MSMFMFFFVFFLLCFYLFIHTHTPTLNAHTHAPNKAFMCLFQILTQEGWVEIVDETSYAVGQHIAPLVVILFLFCHIFSIAVSSCNLAVFII